MSLRSRKYTRRRSGLGFTLVELAVTVVIIGIIAMIAVPSFTNMVRRSRLSAAANEMVALLQGARTAAISRRMSATVCPSSDGASCSATLGNRWISFLTRGGVQVGPVLRDTTLQPNVTVKASANLAGATNRFTFLPSGFSSAGAAGSGTVAVCSAELAGSNAVDVSASIGRISTQRREATAACTTPVDN